MGNAQQPQTAEPTPRTEFMRGAGNTLPLVIGAVPFGIIFGVVAVGAGLSPLATLGMSLFVFAGSAQFIAAGLIAQSVASPIIIFTAFIVNLRHVLYAASLAPYMKHLPTRWLLPLGFWLTDETFAVVVRRYPQPDASPYKHWYHLGSSLAMYGNWQLCTIVGMIAGTSLEGLADLGLDFAMVVTFIGIVVPLITTQPMLVCAVVAGAVAVLAQGLPNQMGLMVAALAGMAAGVIVESVKQQSD